MGSGDLEFTRGDSEKSVVALLQGLNRSAKCESRKAFQWARSHTKLKLSLIAIVLLVIPLCQVNLISDTKAHSVKNLQVQSVLLQSMILNIDGNLKANITEDDRERIWMGKCGDGPDWFSGNLGNSTLEMGFDFSDSENPVAICDLKFVNASGNRPFAFMSALNGAFPKMYLNQTSNIVVHFDINLEDFTWEPGSWLRTGVVVAIQSNNGSERAYFEQDIKDSDLAKLAMPFHGRDVTESLFTDIEIGIWQHLQVPFDNIIQSDPPPIAEPFLQQPNSTFIESVYLVNECFGSGHIKYSLANWWITAETIQPETVT